MTGTPAIPLSPPRRHLRWWRAPLLLLPWLLWGWHSQSIAAPATVAFSGFSETLVRYYQQEENDQIKNLLALVEIIAFSSEFPKVPELSFHLFGWGQLHLLDETSAIGDLNTAYVSYRDPKHRIWVAAGRQYLFQNQKTLHFDGIKIDARLPKGFGVRVFGGFAVRPQFAPSAGYFLTGIRLSHRVGHISEIGVTFLETLEAGQPAQEVLGIDAMVLPFRWLELSTSASMDVHLLTLRQAGGRIDVTPWRWLRLSAGYEFSTPSAFISKSSIFSVFSTNSYHEGYVQAWLYLLGRRLAIGTDLRLIHLPDTEGEQTFPSGEQNRVFVRWQYRQEPSGWIGATFERIREGNDGHMGARLFWQQQIKSFVLAADFQYYYYTREIQGYPHGFFASLSGQWKVAKGWDITGSLALTSNPFVTQSWMGLLKLRYQFFVALPVNNTLATQANPPITGGKP